MRRGVEGTPEPAAAGGLGLGDHGGAVGGALPGEIESDPVGGVDAVEVVDVAGQPSRLQSRQDLLGVEAVGDEVDRSEGV